MVPGEKVWLQINNVNPQMKIQLTEVLYTSYLQKQLPRHVKLYSFIKLCMHTGIKNYCIIDALAVQIQLPILFTFLEKSVYFNYVSVGNPKCYN